MVNMNQIERWHNSPSDSTEENMASRHRHARQNLTHGEFIALKDLVSWIH